jgi:D-serine deaminase-like pyridoxal phosphate-dependent protein
MATTVMGGVQGEIGRAVTELDTPALLVDLDTFERNVARMAAHFKRAGVNWRPHTKGQKVPALVHKELAAGAFGATCAKLGEAEVLADAGIDNILIANQIVGRAKLTRLMALRRRASVLVGLDSEANAVEMDEVAREWGVRQGVLIEVDSGMQRCGVQPGAPTVELARLVAGLPGLELKGVMSWEGHTIRTPETEKPAVVAAALAPVIETATLLREARLPCEIVSCGGTGTYKYSALVPGVTEIQAGGGVFGDLTYASWGVDHDYALTLLATVISTPTPTRAVVDAGKKSMSSDSKVPMPKGLTGVTSVGLSAEHGRIEFDQPHGLRVGDKVEFVVGYGDTTVHLHDTLYGVREGIVEAAWPVAGRGRTR